MQVVNRCHLAQRCTSVLVVLGLDRLQLESFLHEELSSLRLAQLLCIVDASFDRLKVALIISCL